MSSLKNPHCIMLIGNCGTGKSTLAAMLGTRLDIPVIHLDKLRFRAGWKEIDNNTFLFRLQEEMNKNPKWIMDGNYSSSMDFRAGLADTIIFLKAPLFISYIRILKRRLMYAKKQRPDVPEECPENLNWEMLKWIWSYKKRASSRTEALIQKYKDSKNIIILDSLKKVKLFILSLS